jgi:hypothetical protein
MSQSLQLLAGVLAVAWGFGIFSGTGAIVDGDMMETLYPLKLRQYIIPTMDVPLGTNSKQ